MNLTDFGFIMRNRIAYGINAVSQRLIEKLQDEKLDKIIVEATTSVTDYLVPPYTMLSALPFGDSSLRLGDGSIFVHKDEMIESTMIMVFNNGIRTYGLAVDSDTGEVTQLIDQGSWTLNQVGLSVNDIYNPSYWVDTNPSLKSTIGSLNTSLQTRYFQAANVNFFVLSDMVFFQIWSTGLSLNARTWTNICQVPSGVPLPTSDEGAINIPIVGGDQRQYSGVIRIYKTDRQVAAFGSHSSGTQKYWGRSFYFTHS